MNLKKNFFNRGLYTTSGEDDLILHQPLFDYQRDVTDIRNFKLSTYYEIKRTGIRDWAKSMLVDEVFLCAILK